MTDQNTATPAQRVTLPDGSHLAVQLHGPQDAPAVLLIAGVAGVAADHTTWGTFPDTIATTFRVITYVI